MTMPTENKLGENIIQKQALSSRAILAIFLAAFLIIGGGAAFFIGQKIVTERALYSGYFSDLKGIVYFAFADKDDLAGDLYAFDVRKRTYKRLFDDGFVKYTGKLSPQGDEIAYFAA